MNNKFDNVTPEMFDKMVNYGLRIGSTLKGGIDNLMSIATKIKYRGKVLIWLKGSKKPIETTEDMLINGMIQSAMSREKALMKFACIQGTCFTSNTLVLTESGYKRIDNMEVGELVKAKDEFFDRYDYKKVKKIFKNNSNIIINIKINENIIRTTPSHPFCFEDDTWMEASKLKVRYKLKNSNGGLTIIDEISEEKSEEIVYNMHVDYNAYGCQDNFYIKLQIVLRKF